MGLGQHFPYSQLCKYVVSLAANVKSIVTLWDNNEQGCSLLSIDIVHSKLFFSF